MLPHSSAFCWLCSTRLRLHIAYCCCDPEHKHRLPSIRRRRRTYSWLQFGTRCYSAANRRGMKSTTSYFLTYPLGSRQSALSWTAGDSSLTLLRSEETVFREAAGGSARRNRIPDSRALPLSKRAVRTRFRQSTKWNVHYAAECRFLKREVALKTWHRCENSEQQTRHGAGQLGHQNMIPLARSSSLSRPLWKARFGSALVLRESYHLNPRYFSFCTSKIRHHDRLLQRVHRSFGLENLFLKYLATAVQQLGSCSLHLLSATLWHKKRSKELKRATTSELMFIFQFSFSFKALLVTIKLLHLRKYFLNTYLCYDVEIQTWILGKQWSYSIRPRPLPSSTAFSLKPAGC